MYFQNYCIALITQKIDFDSVMLAISSDGDNCDNNYMTPAAFIMVSYGYLNSHTIN